MIADFKARLAFARTRHEAFIIRVKEGLLSDLIHRDEMKECFWMGGDESHGEKTTGEDDGQKDGRETGEDAIE